LHYRQRAFARAVKKLQATSLVFMAELKMAADNSQQTMFYFFIGQKSRNVVYNVVLNVMSASNKIQSTDDMWC